MTIHLANLDIICTAIFAQILPNDAYHTANADTGSKVGNIYAGTKQETDSTRTKLITCSMAGW